MATVSTEFVSSVISGHSLDSDSDAVQCRVDLSVMLYMPPNFRKDEIRKYPLLIQVIVCRHDLQFRAHLSCRWMSSTAMVAE